MKKDQPAAAPILDPSIYDETDQHRAAAPALTMPEEPSHIGLTRLWIHGGDTEVVLASYYDALRSALTAALERVCHHGWRSTTPEDGKQIVTPCPACGAKSLFIGSGGHLTCARVPSHNSDGCLSPSVEATVKELKQRAEAAERQLAEALELLEDSKRNRRLGIAQIDFWKDKAETAEQKLTAALEQSQRMYEHYQFELNRANESERRAQENERDAERYRWLRDVAHSVDRFEDRLAVIFRESPNLAITTPSQLDAAIDAAREKERE